MIHIEELQPGTCFLDKDHYYIVTCDFKYDSKSCICLSSGLPRWFKINQLVDKINIYTIDQDNNTIPIKHDK